jgi:uncharacterized protein DUF2442
MGFLRIREVAHLHEFRLQLTLTDGSIIGRDVSALMVGPLFEPLRADRARFTQARVEGDTVTWSNGADLLSGVDRRLKRTGKFAISSPMPKAPIHPLVRVTNPRGPGRLSFHVCRKI